MDQQTHALARMRAPTCLPTHTQAHIVTDSLVDTLHLQAQTR